MKASRHVALVTGVASGPGLATVKELHANGAHVVILDLPSSRGKEIAGELGDRAVFSPGDVTLPASVAAAREWVSAPAGRITEPGGALAGALELAERITANAPLAIAATKEIITGSADWTSRDMWRRQEDLVRPVVTSADAREGASAFAEKRALVWRGK